MKKNLITHIYESHPIDVWPHWECLFLEKTSPLGLRKMAAITTREFAYITEFLRKISELGWEGDLRNDTEIYMAQLHGDCPGGSDESFIIGLKQDSNGITFIGLSEDMGGEVPPFLFDYSEQCGEARLVYEYKAPAQAVASLNTDNSLDEF